MSASLSSFCQQQQQLHSGRGTVGTIQYAWTQSIAPSRIRSASPLQPQQQTPLLSASPAEQQCTPWQCTALCRQSVGRTSTDLDCLSLQRLKGRERLDFFSLSLSSLSLAHSSTVNEPSAAVCREFSWHLFVERGVHFTFFTVSILPAALYTAFARSRTWRPSLCPLLLSPAPLPVVRSFVRSSQSTAVLYSLCSTRGVI